MFKKKQSIDPRRRGWRGCYGVLVKAYVVEEGDNTTQEKIKKETLSGGLRKRN